MTTDRPNTRLAGHTLAHEGAPHDVDGVRIPWSMSTLGSQQQGCARCSCGTLSDMLSSTAARRRWHSEHKDAHR